MSGHTSRIPHWLQEHGLDLGLLPGDLAVYAALLHEADWSSGITRRVGMASIARLAAMRATNTVAASLRRLQAAGVVVIHEEGVNRPHTYRLGMMPPALSTQDLSTEESSIDAPGPQYLRGAPQDLRPQTSNSEVDLEENSLKRDSGAPPQADDEEEIQAFLDAYPRHRHGKRAHVIEAWNATKADHPDDLLGRLAAYLRQMDGKERFIVGAPRWLLERMWEQFKPEGPSRRYQDWIKTPEGQAHLARKEPVSE